MIENITVSHFLTQFKKSKKGIKIKNHKEENPSSIKDFMPSPEVINIATEAFTSANFKVEPVIANNFSIIAPARTFEKLFEIGLVQYASRGIEIVRDNGSVSYGIPWIGCLKGCRI